ncbi:hypothetical protein FE257_009358, partial [Aspergillus nanangensis]
DYDCFYASVFEVEQPILKSLPLAVQQKQIVVTCNYEARRRGLRKLQLIKEAKQICPDVVIVLGEDLSRFRDASKDLYLLLRSFVWGGKVERLGFDEVFLDVTDMITYNVDLLNQNDLGHSFFHLDQQDPTVGFAYDATSLYGPTYPADAPPALAEPPSTWLHTRLLVASHLAAYMRSQIEEHKGYTATVGVSTSKLLAKLAGNRHKPNSQTTLLPPYISGEISSPSNVNIFLDSHEIRKVPGIGSKLAQKLTAYLEKPSSDTPQPDIAQDDQHLDLPVTIRDLRLSPGMSPPVLDKILGGPGFPKDIGVKIWRLIHGVDSSEVSQARDLPTQISIEDSYGRLDTLDGVRKELLTLTSSLIRRMRTDLTEKDASRSPGKITSRWVARPRTFRLSTRPRLPSTPEGTQVHNFNRISRSAPLPQFIFNQDECVESLAERLVDELSMSMFRKLHSQKSGWNLRLLNVAVTNMMEGAGTGKQSSGQDIGQMFQNKGAGRRERSPISEIEGTSSPVGRPLLMDTPNHRPGLLRSDSLAHEQTTGIEDGDEAGGWEEESDGEEDDMSCVVCVSCGALIPHFALIAHEMYHSAPD